MSYRSVIGASVFTLGLALTGSALAASPDTGSAKPVAKAEAATEAAKFTDAKLASFAAAQKKVNVLNKQYQQRAAGAVGPEAKSQVEQLKNIDLADAVKSEGLTTQEYNEIFMAMKADPTLASKIATLKTAAAANPTDTKIR